MICNSIFFYINTYIYIHLFSYLIKKELVEEEDINSLLSVETEIEVTEDFQILSLQPLVLQLSGY